jgi:molybdopterin synthase catalytic subunit
MKNSFIEGAISPEKIATSIAHHQHKTNIGGHSIFLGQVRADEIGKSSKSHRIHHLS